jgi:GDP-4-dehydro-6-deoxy-D-mannose reductase
MLPVTSAVIFNILGPGQPDALVPMTFIRQLKELQHGAEEVLKVGNIDTRRDFVDVRDVESWTSVACKLRWK